MSKLTWAILISVVLLIIIITLIYYYNKRKEEQIQAAQIQSIQNGLIQGIQGNQTGLGNFVNQVFSGAGGFLGNEGTQNTIGAIASFWGFGKK